MSQGELAPLGSALDELFRRLGIPDPELMSRLAGDWDTVAGDPWAGRSRPVYIRDRTLVVEAASPSLVAFLRYGVTGLLATLEETLGKGVVARVEVAPPSR